MRDPPNSRSDGGEPPSLPLSDEQIYDLAANIRRAVRLRERNDNRPPEILSLRRELPPDDEDRVIAALEVLQLLDDTRR